MIAPLALSVLLTSAGLGVVRLVVWDNGEKAWDYLVGLLIVWGGALPLLGLLWAGGVRPPALRAKWVSIGGLVILTVIGSLYVLFQRTVGIDFRTGLKIVGLIYLVGIPTGSRCSGPWGPRSSPAPRTATRRAFAVRVDDLLTVYHPPIRALQPPESVPGCATTRRWPGSATHCQTRFSLSSRTILRKLPRSSRGRRAPPGCSRSSAPL